MHFAAFDFHKKFQAILIQQDIDNRRLAESIAALTGRLADYLFRITVNPTQLTEVIAAIAPHHLSIGTVIGYPLGNLHSSVKAVQLKAAREAGADHVDIVLPIEHLLDGAAEKAAGEVRQLTTLSRELGLTAAWVANLAFLNDAQRQQAVALIGHAGTPLVTNSGFNNQTELSDLAAVIAINDTIPVTACGGIESAEQAAAFLVGGAARVAVHSPLDVLAGLETLLTQSE